MGQIRIQKLAEALRTVGWDAFFACNPVSMSYLQGYGEDPHERFLTIAISAKGQVVMICPSLSETQARRTGLTDIRTWRDGENPLALFDQLADEWDLKGGILAVDDTMPAHMLLRMQDVAPGALFKPGDEVLSTIMRQKSQEELDLLRASGKIADDAFVAVLPHLKPGLTERQIEKLLFDAMIERGGNPTFCIPAAGPNGAEPHHLTDDTVVKPNDVVILDFGCEYKGYQSDITRTVCFGKAPAKAHVIYKIVYDAHMAGRKAIVPGATAESIDAAARKVIDDAGYGKEFFHRLGHGIGMQGHEPPYIVAGNKHVLEPGNCFSIEPGIYLPGEFGIRIENIVAATAEGHMSMNAEPSETLIELG